MEPARATRRYLRGLFLFMLVFLGGSLGIYWLEDNHAPKALLAVLAVVPVGALLMTFWVQWRYLRDIDEYLRQLHIKALLVGAALALGIGTGWGYLEALVDAPSLWVFLLNPLFWIAYGIAVIGFSLKDGVDLT